jgi:predicted Zn-dependent protease
MENAIKIIGTIGKQWPFLLVLFFIIIFILKWKTIWEFIASITQIRIKRGNTEVELHKEEKKEEKKEEEIKKESSEIEDSKLKSENASELTKDESDGFRYYHLLKERKFEEAKQSFEEILKKVPDDRKRRERRINNFHWRHIHGDVNAFDEFEEYITKVDTDNELKALINNNLSWFYQDSSNYSKAIELLYEAIEFTSKSENKAFYVSRISDIYYEGEEKQKSINVLFEYLNKLNERKSKYKLYSSIAEYYKKENNTLYVSLAYQKALECQPNDTGLIFDAAYNFTQVEDKYSDIGLILYKKLTHLDPKNHGALNNLGVSYKDLELPFKSVHYYKKALKSNSTLAAANLAYLLMNVGFEKEAEEYLNNAQNKESIHDNVFSAVSSLKSRLNKEEELEDKIVKSAEKKYRFFNSLGESAFTLEKIKIENSTKWKLEGKEVKIVDNEGAIDIYWENGEEKHSLSGIRNNNSLDLSYHKPQRNTYSFKLDDKYVFTDHKGLGCIESQNTIKCMFEIDKEIIDFKFVRKN